MSRFGKLLPAAAGTVIVLTVGCACILNANAGTFDSTIDQMISKEISEKLQSNSLSDSKLPICSYINGKMVQEKCKTIIKINDKEYYFGEMANGKFDGVGVYQVYYNAATSSISNVGGAVERQYFGNWKNGKKHGYGVYKEPFLTKQGFWETDKFISEAKANQSKNNLGQITTGKINPSFDCTKAKSIAEKLICSDNDLGFLDRELNSYYNQAKKLSDDKNFFKKETEAAWIKREKQCLDKNCLINWYAARKSHYGKIIGDQSSNEPDRNEISNNQLNHFDKESQPLADERRRFNEDKHSREIVRSGQRINLQVTNTQPDASGAFNITIKTNTDTASLKINEEEQGGKQDGSYLLKKVARAGQETNFTIVAIDTNGNSATKTITVSRPLANSKPLVAALNPAQVKRQPERDAVAIIIGIADYKNLPRADYANDDARVFYDYAIRALGVKPENINLLVDADADEVGIYRAFKTWLPSRVRASTDVYVYYSGHGLPTADGQGLYVLPQRADRDFMDKTAITQAEINAAIQAAKPKSVTIFLDACYSGQARTGETLLASARPVSLKAETAAFPEGFTVITASRGDQVSSSSPELKHGIFSYYLMRGMEGDADANRDGRITAGEMQAYLAENVARQAGMMNRRQEPQLLGDANRVLVGR
jgi:uncharacterized protein